MQKRRRRLMGAMAGALATVSPFARAAARVLTPAQGKGPFYPLDLPLDHDNDLVRVEGQDGRAVGTIVDVVGQLLDADGKPLAGVQIEIWQVNGYGRYHHRYDDQDKPWDPNFQGFGRTLTASDGSYRFRTVRPVAYPGRAPHIHFAISDRRFATFYTQMYIAGAPENDGDFLLRRVRDVAARERLIVPLRSSAAAGAEQVGRFDIVLGQTNGS